MFGPSNFNGEDLDDYLVLQRDWGVDGGLRPVDEARVREVRERAAKAVQAVYRELGLADFADERVAEVVAAEGSRDLPPLDATVVLEAADAIQERKLGILDVVGALESTGFREEAERVLAMGRARVAGDYLQTAAIFDEQMNVLSKITDPNDYRGPGTGYEAPAARQGRDRGHPSATLTAGSAPAAGGRGGSGRCRPLPPHRTRRGAAGRRPSRGLRGGLAGLRDQAVADHVGAAGGRGAPADPRRAGRGGLRRAPRARARDHRPRPDRLDRGAAGRFGHRGRAAGEGHGAHPPP